MTDSLRSEEVETLKLLNEIKENEINVLLKQIEGNNEIIIKLKNKLIELNSKIQSATGESSLPSAIGRVERWKKIVEGHGQDGDKQYSELFESICKYFNLDENLKLSHNDIIDVLSKRKSRLDRPTVRTGAGVVRSQNGLAWTLEV